MAQVSVHGLTETCRACEQSPGTVRAFVNVIWPNSITSFLAGADELTAGLEMYKKLSLDRVSGNQGKVSSLDRRRMAV